MGMYVAHAPLKPSIFGTLRTRGDLHVPIETHKAASPSPRPPEYHLKNNVD